MVACSEEGAGGSGCSESEVETFENFPALVGATRTVIPSFATGTSQDTVARVWEIGGSASETEPCWTSSSAGRDGDGVTSQSEFPREALGKTSTAAASSAGTGSSIGGTETFGWTEDFLGDGELWLGRDFLGVFFLGHGGGEGPSPLRATVEKKRSRPQFGRIFF